MADESRKLLIYALHLWGIREFIGKVSLRIFRCGLLNRQPTSCMMAHTRLLGGPMTIR